MKQEFYPQRLKSYGARMSKQEPGSKPPQRPKTPKPPTLIREPVSDGMPHERANLCLQMHGDLA